MGSHEYNSLSPDGSRAYVTHHYNHNVSVIDTASNTIVTTIPVGINPVAVAITPDGTRAYVTNHYDSNVSVINTASNTVSTTIAVGRGPRYVAITPDGTRAYVTNAWENTVSVIDTALNLVVATVVGVGNWTLGIAITPNGSHVYVASETSNNVSVIDTASNTVSTTVAVGSKPRSVAITPDGSRAYVTNAWSNTVSVIDTASNLVVATVVGVGNWPEDVVFTPDTKPVAHAGADQAITLLNTVVQLDGTGSYDDDGDPISYDWNITQKPTGSSATLSDPSSATPTFTPDVYGDYVIELTVSDPTETGSTDSVTVSFDNVKPVANAGGNKSSLVGETVVLDGTGSTDANGDPLTYSWNLVSKPAGSSATLSGSTNPTTSFVGDISGTYDINLTVNDGLLDSDPNSASVLTITVMNAMTLVLNDAMVAINNIPPVALKNPNMANALTQKINAVLKMIEQEQYQEALDKLTDDILIKTDGCANGGEPDEDDWIKTCGEQDVVYSFIMEAISIVKRQI